MTACGIIADNAFGSGRFTLDRAGRVRVSVALDDVLTDKTYYFFVGDAASMY